MTWRRAIWIGATCTAAIAAAVGGAPISAGIEAWFARLEALHPGDPMGYFTLAEDVADTATDRPERELAQRLFALAGLLDTERLGRSACLALADMEESEPARRRLLALAALLGSPGLGSAPPSDAAAGLGSEFGPGAVLAVTEAFSHYRRGKGSRVSSALRGPGAMELLAACEPFLAGGVNRFLEDSRRYRGNLRPSLSDEDVTTMLRLEIALLAGADRSWSAELLVGRGRPLIEVDPDRLSETLPADPSRALFRNGRWVEADTDR